MSLKDALATLDDRAKNGKTAQVLIQASESEISTLTTQLQDAMEICRTQERTVKDLESQVTAMKNPVVRTSVDGDTIDHTYRPNIIEKSESQVYYGHQYVQGLWRLDEIESALTHLRVSGAEDETTVTVKAGVLKAGVQDHGGTPSPWSFSVPEKSRTFLDRAAAASLVLSPVLLILGVVGWIW